MGILLSATALLLVGCALKLLCEAKEINRKSSDALRQDYATINKANVSISQMRLDIIGYANDRQHVLDMLQADADNIQDLKRWRHWMEQSYMKKRQRARITSKPQSDACVKED